MIKKTVLVFWFLAVTCICLGSTSAKTAAMIENGPVSQNTQETTGLVWQLGLPDRSSSEFLPMNPTDFCQNPEMVSSPDFDIKTHRFTYTIKSPGIDKIPRIPAGITSRRGVPWYGTPLCTTLVISWEEKEAGDRILEIHTVSFRRDGGCGGRVRDFEENDVRVNLPGNKLTYLQMKNTRWNADTEEGKGNADLAWEIPLVVKPGMNTVTIEMRNPWSTTNVQLDYLVLVKGKSPEVLNPALEMETKKLITMYLPDEPIILNARCYNLQPSFAYRLKYQVSDFYGKIKEEKNVGFQTDPDGYGVIDITPVVSRYGYFKVNAEVLDGNGKTVELAGQPYLYRATFGRVTRDPEMDKEVPDSHFGMHTSLESYNGPMDIATCEKYSVLSRMMGVKLMRVNSFLWMNIEPAKGSYNWQYWDQMVDNYRKHKLVILGCLTGTPKWARLHPDEVYTNNGFFEEPRMEDWLNFVNTTVTRYKDKIDWWEAWNEPFSRPTYYWSAYGKEYGQLAGLTYDTIKKIQPDSAVVLGMTHPTPYGAKFQEETIAACGRERFDILNDHYLDLNACKTWENFRAENKYTQPLWDTENNTNDDYAGIIKIAARNLAYDIDKTFFFTFNYDSWTDTYDEHIVVNPSCLALRTACDHLEHAQYLGSLNTGENTETYAFTRGKEIIIVTWSNVGDKEISLPVSAKSVSLYDSMDNASSARTENGLLKLKINQEPIIIRGADFDEITAGTAFQIDPAETVILCGSSQKFQINIRNTYRNDAEYKIEFKLPDGWTDEIKERKFILKSTEKKTVSATVNVPPDAGHEKCEIQAVIKETCAGKLTERILSAGIVTVEKPLGLNLINNSGFEEIGNSNVPKNWEFYNWDGKSTAKLEMSKEAAHSGQWGVRFSSLAKDDNAILFYVPEKRLSVLPGEKYVISLWCKGDRDALRSGTHFRQFDDAGSYVSTESLAFTFNMEKEWTRPYGIYTVPPGIEGIDIAFICWQMKGTIDFDDVSLVQVKEVPSPNKLKFWFSCIKTATLPKMDGTLSGWEKAQVIRLDQKNQARRHGGAWNDEPYDWSGPDDLSADIYTMWDKDYFYLTVKVADNVFYPYQTREDGGDIYLGDSVQFALDPSNEARNMFQDYVEMALGRSKEGVSRIYQWNYLPNPLLRPDMYSGRVERAKINTAPTPPGGVLYQAAIPWSCFASPEIKAGKKFGFSLLVNDNDGQDRRGWLQWSSGIGQEKNPKIFGTMVLSEVQD